MGLERRLVDILEIVRTIKSMTLEGFVSDRLGKMTLKGYLFANVEENANKPLNHPEKRDHRS
jgi:hypothetical protein